MRTKEQTAFLCDAGGSVGWWEWADGGKFRQGSVFERVGEREEVKWFNLQGLKNKVWVTCGQIYNFSPNLSPLDGGDTRFRQSGLSSWEQVTSSLPGEGLLENGLGIHAKSEHSYVSSGPAWCMLTSRLRVGLP